MAKKTFHITGYVTDHQSDKGVGELNRIYMVSVKI